MHYGQYITFEQNGLTCDADKLVQKLRLDQGLPEYAEFLDLFAVAKDKARPRGILLKLPVTGRRHTGIDVPGATFTSPLLSRQFNGDELYIDIAACGPELDLLADAGDDPLRTYWLEALKMEALAEILCTMQKHIQAHLPGLQSIHPTDDNIWPVSGLRDIFNAVPEDAHAFLNIFLSDNFYMLPNKSHAGILFAAADSDFCPCDHCSINADCPNNRRLSAPEAEKRSTHL